MTPEEHKQKHVELCRAFDELLADFIRNDKQMRKLSQIDVLTLMMWAVRQNAPRQFPARSDGKLDADVGGSSV